MIKFDYFGKLLKYGLFTLLISCFILLLSSSVSAVNIQKNGQYVVSALDSSIDFQVNNKGQLMSSRLGNTKRVLSFISNDSQKIFFWFGPGKKPYSLVQWPGRGVNQGFYNRYFLCDELTSGSVTVMDNCSSFSVSSDFGNEMGSFFQSITVNDYWGYDVHTWDCYHSPQLVNRVCFSSSEFHKSICFANGMGNSSVCQCDYCNDTNSSLNLDYDRQFTAIPDSVIETPPGSLPIGSIDGSSSVGNNVSLTGNLMYNSCTKGYILNQLEGILHEGFCYAGTYNTGLIDVNFTGNTYVYGYGMTFRDMYKLSKSNGPNYNSYNDWYLSHFDSIKRYKLGQISTNPFIGEPIVVYSYFNNLYSNYGIDIADLSSREFSSYGILNYCNLYFSESDLSSEYTGQYFQYLCNSLSNSDGSINLTTGAVGNPEESIEVLPPGFDLSNNPSSGVVVSVDWSGTLTGNTNQNFDGKNFINNFYQKLQSVFQKPINSATGIIPSYILVFLVAIILFRFIQH